MQRTRRIMASSLITLVFMLGCESSNDTNSGGTNANTQAASSTDYTTATLTHSGFDFSTGKQSADANYDGETVTWQSGGITHPTYARDSYVWWRPSGSRRTKDMGTVTMSSVTTVSGTWDATPNIPPMLVGHIMVAECADGYVKFEVLSADPNDADWSARVTYYFSTTTTFDK